MRRFSYRYQDSQGLKHEAEIVAANKDEAYKALREKGIRPIKVVEIVAPVIRRGFAGLRKRDWSLIFAVGVVIIVGLSYLLSDPAATDQVTVGGDAVVALPRSRRQIENLPSDFPNGLTNVFRHTSERFLARCAQPGSTYAFGSDSLSDLPNALEREIVIHDRDAAWVQELKRIVAWTKEEAATLVRSGKSLSEIEYWFVERQKMEAGFREQIVEKVSAGRLAEKEANTTLSMMQLETLKRPLTASEKK